MKLLLFYCISIVQQICVTSGTTEEPRRAEKRDGAAVGGLAETDFRIPTRGDIITPVT